MLGSMGEVKAPLLGAGSLFYQGILGNKLRPSDLIATILAH